MRCKKRRRQVSAKDSLWHLSAFHGCLHPRQVATPCDRVGQFYGAAGVWVRPVSGEFDRCSHQRFEVDSRMDLATLLSRGSFPGLSKNLAARVSEVSQVLPDAAADASEIFSGSFLRRFSRVTWGRPAVSHDTRLGTDSLHQRSLPASPRPVARALKISL